MFEHGKPKSGAPRGNSNSRKHGLFAIHFNPEEKAELRQLAWNNLLFEILATRSMAENAMGLANRKWPCRPRILAKLPASSQCGPQPSQPSLARLSGLVSWPARRSVPMTVSPKRLPDCLSMNLTHSIKPARRRVGFAGLPEVN